MSWQCITIKYEWSFSQAAHCRLINPQHIAELGARMQLKYDKEAAPKKIAFVLMEDYSPSSRFSSTGDK